MRENSLSCAVQKESYNPSLLSIPSAQTCPIPDTKNQVVTSILTILVNNQLDALFQCIYLFISLLYMFRAPQFSSSGESIASIHHLVYITLCLVCRHTTQSPTMSDTYQMMYWCNWFSWWWALGCSKHVKVKQSRYRPGVAQRVPGS
jgi:hypothetical protein